MPRAQNDTKAEIRAVALDFFGQKGYEKTSLREIAEQLDITKAALYYHFPSKKDLLRALIDPLRDDTEEMLEWIEGGSVKDPREILGGYFDLCVRHSTLLLALLNDMGALAEMGFVESVVAWRQRLDRALVGPEPATPAKMGAVTALGGIQDIAVMLPPDECAAHRAAAVGIALSALEAGMADKD
ncbi:TetR/AcrR family transcriptional regulator [Nocardiopsis oceani]